MPMNLQNLQLRSLVREDNTLELSLHEYQMPAPGPDEVIVRVEATPLNPSDLALLLGPADIGSARVSGSPATTGGHGRHPGDVHKNDHCETGSVPAGWQ